MSDIKDVFARTVDSIIGDVLDEVESDKCNGDICILDEIICRTKNLIAQMSIVASTIIAHRNKGFDEFDEELLKFLAKRILLEARDNLPDLHITSIDMSCFPEKVREKILQSKGDETKRLIKHYAEIYANKSKKPKSWE